MGRRVHFPPPIDGRDRLALALELEPYNGQRRAGLVATGLIDVALGGRDEAVRQPKVSRRLNPRELEAQRRLNLKAA